MRLTVLTVLTLLWASITPTTQAQTPTKNISAVFAIGKVDGNEYKNSYFGLTLTPLNAQFTQGAFISSAGNRARLVDARAKSTKWEDKYAIAILADALSANPRIHSPAQYVRSVRLQFEREGMVTIQEESPIEISGLHFVEATMKVTEEGQTHYQGMYTTFLNGYILSLHVEATKLERLKQIATRMVRFEASSKRTR